jgi:hypothetical protein
MGIASGTNTTVKANGGTMNLEASGTNTIKGSAIQMNP